MKNLIMGMMMLMVTPLMAKIVVLDSPNSPTVVFRIQFAAGSIHDPQGMEGAAHLLGWLLTSGGTQDLTYRQVQEQLYPMAGRIDVVVEKETTTFLGEVHRDHLDRFYKLFSQLLLNPRFDGQDFDRMKTNAINALEVDLKSADDEDLGKESLQRALYPDHPYGHPVLGTAKGLNAVTLDALKVFYREHYLAFNVTLGLAGPLPKNFVKKVEKDFLKLPKKPYVEKPLPQPKTPTGVEVTLIKKDAMATAVSIGFPVAVNRSSPDFIPLLTALSYLGEHRTFNGLLMNKMRGDRGLNYGDYAYAEYFRQDGGSTFILPNIPRRQQFFSIWIRPVAHENAVFSARMALREVKTLIEKGIAKEDFEKTREFLSGYSKLWVQTLSRRLGFLMDSQWYGGKDFIQDIDKRLKTLTVEEVNAAVKKYLVWDKVAVVMVTPEAEKFKTILEQGLPTPIKYQTEGTKCEILQEDKDIESFPLPNLIVTVVPIEQLF
jgi:zinc protease